MNVSGKKIGLDLLGMAPSPGGPEAAEPKVRILGADNRLCGGPFFFSGDSLGIT